MNAVVVPPIGDVETVSAWPRSLPRQQVDSIQINWALPTDDIGTLMGPTRFRRAHPNASPSYEFEIWFTDFECEQFEAWFNDACARGGELYLPWIGEARILYISEYELTPYANGWKLHALAVQLYVDPDYCLRHVCDAVRAWRAPVIVDADADYSIIKCELPSQRWRPRFVDSFFGTDPIGLLIDEYDASDQIIADLTATDVWNGHTLSRFAELADTIVCDLSSTNVLVDIPENWQWDDQIEEWYARNRMVYIDDWSTLWLDAGRCWLLKDTLPPPWPIVNGSNPAYWEGLRIISNNFPLETYVAC